MTDGPTSAARHSYLAAIEAVAVRLSSSQLTHHVALLELHLANQRYACVAGTLRANHEQAHALERVRVLVGDTRFRLAQVLGMSDQRPEARRVRLLEEGWLLESSTLQTVEHDDWRMETWYRPSLTPGEDYARTSILLPCGP